MRLRSPGDTLQPGGREGGREEQGGGVDGWRQREGGREREERDG